MYINEQIREINKTVHELKVTDSLLDILVDHKYEMTADVEEWQDFLTYFSNATGKVSTLKYIEPSSYPEPELQEVDVDVAATDFKFYIRKYNQLYDYIQQLETLSDALMDELVEGARMKEWKESLTEIKEDMEELHEYINSYSKLKL